MLNTTTSKYFPSFLWDYWLSTNNANAARPPRVHLYDVYDNELQEIHNKPDDHASIFQDLNIGVLDGETRQVLGAAEDAFLRLESETRCALDDILAYTMRNDSGVDQANRNTISVSRISVETLRKYFVFLRFRNSTGYEKTVQSLEEAYQCHDQEGNIFTAFRPLIVQHRLRNILWGFIKFFDHKPSVSGAPMAASELEEETPLPGTPTDKFINRMNQYCWRFGEAELCFGVARDDQEFILSDRCFGTLDKGVEDEDASCDLFFPVAPTLALYILGSLDDPEPPSSLPQRPSRVVWLDIGPESAVDVHLRNSMILQTYPRHLYFQSLRTVALSVSSYEEFRSTPEHLDYSRLKQRCRQKFLQETVTKTLIVKGSVVLTDLTDEVVILGDAAVAHGSFSDVWKGTWEDPIEGKERVVALKFLRQVMVQGVREKLLKRLQTEVLAWHRLCHKNVSQLFGIVQSPHSIAMVSQWCDNGTVSHYLNTYPDVNRLKLLTQVASGIAHLHHLNIIHGDLKGGNILVDGQGNAIITDFGLSKVMEEINDNMNMGTSFFAGSTRWMAPELIQALAEDDGHIPPITTFSDVYAFASVCLEIASGQLPYPHRTNDYAVTLDILRGVRPCRSAQCLLKLIVDGEQAFWSFLEQCWSVEPTMRPTMTHMLSFLDVLAASSCVR